MLETIRLCRTKGNEIVTEAIPVFKEHPQVITWCGKFFIKLRVRPPVPWGVVPDDETMVTTYIEVHAYDIPEPEATARAMGSKHSYLPAKQ